MVDNVCLNSPAATITLTSNVGGKKVCPGEVVTYMCIATGVGVLEWTAEPFILDSGGNRITYLNTDVQRIGQTMNCVDPSPAQDCADFQSNPLKYRQCSDDEWCYSGRHNLKLNSHCYSQAEHNSGAV